MCHAACLFTHSRGDPTSNRLNQKRMRVTKIRRSRNQFHHSLPQNISNLGKSRSAIAFSPVCTQFQIHESVMISKYFFQGFSLPQTLSIRSLTMCAHPCSWPPSLLHMIWIQDLWLKRLLILYIGQTTYTLSLFGSVDIILISFLLYKVLASFLHLFYSIV